MNFGASRTLAAREIQRFFRQPSRVMAAVGTPLLFWLVLGSGLGSSFHPEGGPPDSHFLHYFFPGILILTVMFAAIFSSISTIEDRNAGFLQGVLASPAPRSSIVLGKILGGTALALIQGGGLLLLAPAAGFSFSPLGFLLSLLFLVLTAFSMTALGFVLAWRMDSIQGFHAVMNLLLMPLWMLSGAVFPASGAQVWIRAMMAINPLAYGLEGLRNAMEGSPVPVLDMLLILVSGALLFGASVVLAGRKAR